MNNSMRSVDSGLAVFAVTRPNFLVLTPICLSLGLVSALAAGEPIAWSYLWIILLGGLMAHVSVNALNEYQDFRSGLDFNTIRTPFSGGSGTLVKAPQLAQRALALAVGAYLTTLLLGLYLVWQVGWGLLPLGLLGLLIILFYTGPINRNRYLVFIAPGLGFGPLMVLGSHYVLTGSYTLLSLLVSLVPFLLVNNLLLLNQVPDIEADRNAGRDNFAIALSPAAWARLYTGFGLLTYLLIGLGVAAGLLPWPALLAMATLHLSLQVSKGISHYDGGIDAMLPFLGKNVMITLLTPLLLSIGLGLEMLR
jgi:1,4-dihydroxy-2-naphthoate octaprenyltransferase